MQSLLVFVAAALLCLGNAAPVETAQSATTCDGDFSLYTNSQTEKTTCFLVVNTWKSWNEAEGDCAQKGAHLASIHNSEFNSFLLSAARGAGIYDSFHIGLTDGAGSGFAWTDASVLNYSNFGPGHPNPNYGHCMYVQIQNLPGLGAGMWFSEQCEGNSLPYVCTKN